MKAHKAKRNEKGPQGQKGASFQGANLNVPQEEMLLKHGPGGGRPPTALTLGFRVCTFDRQCGGVM